MYHHEEEHYEDDAYAYLDDSPKKSVEQLQNGKPRFSFPLFSYQEMISVSADVEADLFAIQENGTYKVVSREFEHYSGST